MSAEHVIALMVGSLFGAGVMHVYASVLLARASGEIDRLRKLLERARSQAQ